MWVTFAMIYIIGVIIMIKIDEIKNVKSICLDIIYPVSFIFILLLQKFKCDKWFWKWLIK